MGLLFVSMGFAAAASASVYMDTSSLLMAFFAYSFVGTVTMLSALATEGLTSFDPLD